MEDSPSEIGIELYNLDNKARQISNRYTSVFFLENSKCLFPRTVMLNIKNKLKKNHLSLMTVTLPPARYDRKFKKRRRMPLRRKKLVMLKPSETS